MRTVAPHTFQNNRKARQKARRRERQARYVAVAVVLGLTLAGALLVDAIKEGRRRETVASATPAGSTSTTPAPKLKAVQKMFTSEQFAALYDAMAYPNTQEILTPPVITGDSAADARIVAKAQERGYKLRSLPVAPITRLGIQSLEGDDLLQEKAAADWVRLSDAAKTANIPLEMTSAYRSPEYQRNIWVQRMQLAGMTVSGVAAGTFDKELDTLLETTSPPGFSRHHTGYTIDIACDGVGLRGVVKTPCYVWLSKDNFAVAKSLGWIPSYPDGLTKQGPNPEPWELVWVGVEAVSEFVPDVTL